MPSWSTLHRRRVCWGKVWFGEDFVLVVNGFSEGVASQKVLVWIQWEQLCGCHLREFSSKLRVSCR